MLLVGVALLTGSSQAGTASEAPPLRVLFIGNSLTLSNDLPATVARFAAASERPELAYRTVAYTGFSLGDHWNLGTARTALSSGGWDVVVMQDIPSSLPEDQESLRTWTSRFADLARAADTRPALLTVLPALERRSTLPDVIASHRLAAQTAGAKLFPAAEAVQAAWRCGLHRSLYSRDLVHPSPLGTYEAALVVYGAPLSRARALSSSLSNGRKCANGPAPASSGRNSARSPATSGQPLRLTLALTTGRTHAMGLWYATRPTKNGPSRSR